MLVSSPARRLREREVDPERVQAATGQDVTGQYVDLQARIQGLATAIIKGNDKLADDLARRGSCDCSYALAESHRFRVNIYRQNGHHAMVLRRLASKIPTMEGLKLAPDSQGVNVEAALAYAVAGETARADSMAQELNRKYPLDTQMQALWLPAIQAQIGLNHKNQQRAIEELQKATGDLEYGQIPFLTNLSCLYPTYIRGQAYLAANQGKEAAAEFQKILDHTGIVWNCWTGSLAHLGIARANALDIAYAFCPSVLVSTTIVS